MPTTSLARRAGARTAALAALTVALGPLSGMATAGAVPLAPGDNGTVKIHSAPFGNVARTPYGDPRDEPKVCKFYIDAANFDQGQEITWNIVTQPPVANGATLSGEIALPTGAGHTLDYTLPDGQYKLTWNITGGSGAGKHKVFKVDCVTPPGGGPGGPNGGPPAGGGGIARDQAFAPVAGAAAVGVAAAGGVVWFRLRRRPHGA
ncbi:hypothetical protein ABZ835_21005 [Streptomyces sp. NPDC047461]|uniref:hypothetical protein n=1 Tax=Streptomyces sp. NPDC047461 TaxID=3155619 RepID=UPI0034012E07